MIFFMFYESRDAQNARDSFVRNQKDAEEVNELSRTHQISVQFFADERTDFHEPHEDEEAAEENRKT